MSIEHYIEASTIVLRKDTYRNTLLVDYNIEENSILWEQCAFLGYSVVMEGLIVDGTICGKYIGLLLHNGYNIDANKSTITAKGLASLCYYLERDYKYVYRDSTCSLKIQLYKPNMRDLIVLEKRGFLKILQKGWLWL